MGVGLISDDFTAAPAATEAEVQSAEAALGFTLPTDYRDFLLQQDGGDGFVGEHYLILWKASELAPFNRDYEVALYAPSFVIFASNGGGEGFAFDTRSTAFPIVQVPFIGMSHESGIPVADTFTQLLKRMEEASALI